MKNYVIKRLVGDSEYDLGHLFKFFDKKGQKIYYNKDEIYIEINKNDKFLVQLNDELIKDQFKFYKIVFLPNGNMYILIRKLTESNGKSIEKTCKSLKIEEFDIKGDKIIKK